MQKVVDRIFRRYGVPLRLNTQGGIAETTGFVHYTATSARKHLLPNYTPLGQMPPGHCRILLPRRSIWEGDQILYDGCWYVVRLVERVWLGDQEIYDRCLCEEKGVDDQWGR